MGYSELVGTALGFEAVKGNKGVMRFNSNGNGFCRHRAWVDLFKVKLQV